MSAILLSLRVVQAGVACLFIGLMLAAVLEIALRRWPALAARRVVWLGGQAALALLFFLSLIPQTSHLSPFPDVALATPLDTLGPRQQAGTAVHGAEAQVPDIEVPAASVSAQPTPADAGARWPSAGTLMASLPAICLLAYCAGLLWRLRSVRHGHALVHALFSAAEPLPASQLRQHGAFGAGDIAELEQHGLTVWETGAAISPMLAGLRKPRLLLPRHLRSFSEEQQRLIVLHELTHWRRRDPLCQALGQALQIVLWFNPVISWLAGKLHWAQELGCDGQVLAGRPQRERQSYAAALVRQLQFQAAAADIAPGLAFGGAGTMANMTARVQRMRQTRLAQPGAAGKAVLSLVLGALLAAGVMLQPAFAWLPAPAPALPASSVSGVPARPWIYPLDKIRVTSFYGVVSKIVPNGHHGIDLAAKKGAPIYAVAAGVATVGHDDHYGNFVTIDHDRHWRSLYAHLDAAGIHTGQLVAAGQTIGKVGATGMATGAHLHVEVWRDGRLVDPQTKLAGLDQLATARALSVRKAQLGH